MWAEDQSGSQERRWREKEEAERHSREASERPAKPRVALDEIVKRFQWSESCKSFFAELSTGATDKARVGVLPLSARWGFFQLLLHGRKHSDYVTADLVKASGLSKTQLEEIQLDEEIQFGNRAPENAPVYLEQELAEILVAAGELGTKIGEDETGKLDHIPAMRHVVAAFVFQMSGDGRLLAYVNARSRKRIEIDPLLIAYRRHLLDKKRNRDRSPEAQAVWGRGVELLTNALRGSQMKFTREASEREGVLDVARYAEVLATLMRQADEEEFNLAIYGQWGRGKTFLMKRTAKALQVPPAGDPRDFETVRFSAWKYPSRPEVWVHLYETMAEAACRGSVFKVLPRVLRAGVAKNGPWALLGALAALDFALVPKLWALAQTMTLLKTLLTVFGLGGLIWIIELALGIHHTKHRLSKNYLTAAHHTEKLGLQATIGKDLRALLVGWVPRGAFGFGIPTCVYAVLAAVFIWTAWHWFDFGFFEWMAVPAVRIAFKFGAVMATIILPCWIFLASNLPSRILLVVDDLDRCDPAHLLSVMESIKLLLEDSEISKRVLVTMLIEEDILKHAIWQKYSHLSDKEAAKVLGTNLNAEQIVRESCDKLFTVHLRLPPLEPHEIKVVVEKFAPQDEPGPYSALVNTMTESKSTTVPRAANATGTKHDINAAKLYLDDDVTDAIFRLVAKKIVLGPEERTAITQELGRQREGTNHIAPLGPRAIRAFIFRYQLTRLILAMRGITSWQPEILIAALADSLYQKSDLSGILAQLKPEVAAVVRQVS